ncbi:MAG: hypothetical protein GY787_05680 [Alteromonadales bacterium]|nr:hypothetical protein [Alteromonadales bacterium]
MYKYLVDGNIIHDGKTYEVIDGVATTPFEIPSLEHCLTGEKIDWKAKGIEAGLKDKDLKKFMGKNKEARQKQLDKLKES